MEDQESQEIMRIAQDYFMQELGDKAKAEEAMGKLANMVQGDGAKLVHLGNTLFLTMVRGKGLVEVHTMGTESPRKMVKNFNDLGKYLKKIGVKTAYSYSDPGTPLAKLAKRALPVKEKKANIDGKEVDVLVMEL